MGMHHGLESNRKHIHAGQDYYLWRVHQLRQGNVKGLAAQGAMSLALRSEPLSADDRAVLLGEQQLPTSSAATAAPQGPGPAQAAGGKAIAGGIASQSDVLPLEFLLTFRADHLACRCIWLQTTPLGRQSYEG